MHLCSGASGFADQFLSNPAKRRRGSDTMKWIPLDIQACCSSTDFEEVHCRRLPNSLPSIFSFRMLDVLHISSQGGHFHGLPFRISAYFVHVYRPLLCARSSHLSHQSTNQPINQSITHSLTQSVYHLRCTHKSTLFAEESEYTVVHVTEFLPYLLECI